ncbi:MAG TPA: hypothetical protein VFI13_11560, partial [Gemmatimonadales bacterium]|nr:hypothetical protein [Gemmatimonadales bacterium]
MRTVPGARIAWIIALMGLVVLVTEWLRAPAFWPVAALLPPAAWILWSERRSGRVVRGAVGAALLLLLALLGRETWSLRQIADHWPAAREALVGAASTQLGADLQQAGILGAEAATRATAACGGTREEAFAQVGRVLEARHPELSVVILQGDGTPWVWAGRPPAIPAPSRDSLGIQSSPHHLALETRRACAHDRQVVVLQLVWASPIDPVAPASLVEEFRRHTDVAVRVWAGDSAPDLPDVFDYQYDTPSGAHTLFSLQAIPPDQGARWQLVLERATARVVALLALLLVLTFVLAPPGIPRAAVVVALAWIGVRAPLDRITAGGSVWSPATYFRDFLGPVSASAGALLVVGAMGTVLAAALWERRPRRRPAGLALAAVLALGAPYLISSLARGITPPADGVRLGLWLLWEFALVAAAGSCVALAAALTRGDDEPHRAPWTWWVGVGAALAAAGLGLSVWAPRGGWPDWYPLPWAVA